MSQTQSQHPLEKFKEAISPEHSKIKVEGDEVTAVIFDEEIDPIKLKFIGDGEFELITEGLTHVALSMHLLFKIVELIEEADEIIANFEYDDEGELVQ